MLSPNLACFIERNAVAAAAARAQVPTRCDTLGSLT
jgi:hypothetical protein